MVFRRFHPENNHDEVCGFEQWDRGAKAMGICGQPAIGQLGVDKDKRKFLCAAHFGYGTSHLHDTQIQEEKKNG